MTYLEKPDPEKPAFQIFPKALEHIQYGRCPCCKKIVNTGQAFNEKLDPEHLSSPFRDDLSRKEYSISGLCQDCQDEVFGVDLDD